MLDYCIILAITLYLSVSIWGCGLLTLRMAGIREQTDVLAAAAGTVTFSILAALIGTLGGFQLLAGFPAFVFLMPMALYGGAHLRLRIRSIGLQPIHWLTAACGVFILIRFAYALIPNPHPDALWYNLPCTRRWFLSGGLNFDTDAIVCAKASFWDYLYLWPNFFLPGNDFKSLLSLQATSQLLHFIFGYCAALFLLFRFLESEFSRTYERYWLILAVLSAAMSRELLYTSVVAKNDWGAISWFLAGVLLLAAEEGRNRFAGWFLIGIACAAKVTLSYVLLPLLLFDLFSRRRAIASVSSIFTIVAVFAPLAFLFARNLIWTGSAFFPSLGQVTDSQYLSATWQHAMAKYDRLELPINWNVVFYKILSFFPVENLFACCFFHPRFFLVRRGASPALAALSMSMLIAVGMFLFGTGFFAEARLLGAVQVIIGALGILGFAQLMKDFKLPQRYHPYVGSIACVVLLWAPSKSLFPLEAFPYSLEDRIMNAAGGPTLRFLQSQQTSGEKVAFVQETRIFYFMPHGVVRIWDSPAMDRAMVACSDRACMLEKLHERNIRYLMLSKYNFDFFYDEKTVRDLSTLPKDFPEAVDVDTEYETLIDLNKVAAP